MAHTKLKPCCSRFQGRVTVEQANLARVAHRAALADAKGQSMTNWKSRIAEARLALEHAQKFQVEHEADHAGEPE